MQRIFLKPQNRKKTLKKSAKPKKNLKKQMMNLKKVRSSSTISLVTTTSTISISFRKT